MERGAFLRQGDGPLGPSVPARPCLLVWKGVRTRGMRVPKFRSDHRSKNSVTVAYATDNSRVIRCGSLVIRALPYCAAKKEETLRSLIAGFLLTTYYSLNGARGTSGCVGDTGPVFTLPTT
jgi:hypothetical protein